MIIQSSSYKKIQVGNYHYSPIPEKEIQSPFREQFLISPEPLIELLPSMFFLPN